MKKFTENYCTAAIVPSTQWLVKSRIPFINRKVMGSAIVLPEILCPSFRILSFKSYVKITSLFIRSDIQVQLFELQNQGKLIKFQEENLFTHSNPANAIQPLFRRTKSSAHNVFSIKSNFLVSAAVSLPQVTVFRSLYPLVRLSILSTNETAKDFERALN